MRWHFLTFLWCGLGTPTARGFVAGALVGVAAYALGMPKQYFADLVVLSSGGAVSRCSWMRGVLLYALAASAGPRAV